MVGYLASMEETHTYVAVDEAYTYSNSAQKKGRGQAGRHNVNKLISNGAYFYVRKGTVKLSTVL